MAMAMMRFYVQKGTHKGLYRSIARTLKFFQTFALVEVRPNVKAVVFLTWYRDLFKGTYLVLLLSVKVQTHW